ncbi:MAG: hypothetical protein RL486_1069 [Actinomycetota bacterium]|jgi:ubiquinone/menaquinone biosynthesis C-methylase UbiE
MGKFTKRRSGDSRTSLELRSMQNDWDLRATEDAWYAIDTMTQHEDSSSFYARSSELVPVICDPVIERLAIDSHQEVVLEIGCGVGRLFPGLSDRFREVSGIDISSVMVAEGERNCPVSARWIVGDGSSLAGVDDCSVGHVISFEVFQHVPKIEFIESYFREIFRVLRVGGTFQIQMRCGSDSKRQEQFRKLPRPMRVVAAKILGYLRRIGVRAAGELMVEGDIDTWLGTIVDPREISSYCANLGFSDLAVLEDSVHVDGMGFWLIGRKAEIETTGRTKVS